MNDSAAKPFVPALGLDWLTPFYDAVAWVLGDRAVNARLIAQAAIVPGHAVLDLGSGTGTLALMVKDRCPDARVSGVDVDPRIVAIARRKAATARADVRFVEGSATEPPFAPALAAARRLLRPGGELHVADWGRPQNALMRLAALTFRVFDGGETTAANLAGELPALIAGAGFVDVRETEHRMTPFGTLTFLRGRTP